MAVSFLQNLKEECVGLQKRVVYLECQNHELAQLLRNRYQFSSAPTLQVSPMLAKLRHIVGLHCELLSYVN